MSHGARIDRRVAVRPHTGPERRLDHAARDRHERFHQLVELAPDGIVIHDGERILWSNAAALRLAGARHDADLVGHPLSRILDPPHLKALAGRLADERSTALDADAQAKPVRDTLRRLDGTFVQVELRALVFLHRGAPAVHLVLRDITERLALEETARRVEASLQQVLRAEALGTLAGGVAHELNNAIAIVLGHGSFVLEGSGDAALVRDDVREMVQAAERAATVTRQLLAFTQHAVHRPQVVDLGEAVRDMEPALARLLGTTRRLELRLEPVRARVDLTHLAEVLLALASNARDATREAGGRVVVSVRRTTFTEPREAAGGRTIPPGRFAELAVADDGVELTPAVRSHMFEPFFTTKPLGEGTGLGLAAVQGILAQAGGYILAESAKGSGTAVRVFFPELIDRPVPAAPLRSLPPRAPDSGSRRSVLVVDDEPAIRAVVARTLRRADVAVTEAADGVEALACIERDGQPGVVLTDLQMPGMGGLELRLAIRDRWPGVPVLLMSGYSADFLAVAGTLDDRDVLLQKPFTAAELTAAVESVLAASAAAGTSPNA